LNPIIWILFKVAISAAVIVAVAEVVPDPTQDSLLSVGQLSQTGFYPQGWQRKVSVTHLVRNFGSSGVSVLLHHIL